MARQETSLQHWAYGTFSTDEKQFRQIMDKGLGILKKKGRATLLDTASKSLPQKLRIPAFADACKIVLSDGSVDDDEKELIDRCNHCSKLMRAPRRRSLK